MSLYSQLHIEATATAAEIRTAYRQLSKKHHPDKGGDPEQFHRINHAYEILSDPAGRELYDQTGVDSLTKWRITIEQNFILLVTNAMEKQASDPRKAIIEMIESMDQQLKSDQQQLERKQQKIEKQAKRTKRITAGPDFVAAAYAEHISKLIDQRSEISVRLKLNQDMLAELEHFEFEIIEPKESPDFWGSVTKSTPSMHRYFNIPPA